MTLTFAQATRLRNELARLEAVRPSTVAAFNVDRATRIDSIRRTLAAATIEPAPHVEDPRVVAALKSAGGGDQFGR